MNRSVVLAIGLIWLGAAGAAFGAEAPPPCGKPLPAVVATVDGDQIPRSAVWLRLTHAGLDACRQALDEAVRAALVRRQAEAYRLQMPPAGVRAAIEKFRARFASDDALASFLTEREATEADLERMVEDRVLLQAIDERQIMSWVFSEALQEEYFEQHRADLVKDRVKVRHIQVGTRQEAERILAEMRTKDRTFADFAGYHSLDAATKDHGGDLGWIERGAMPKEFDDAAFAAEPGGISRPIQTERGWHLIRVEDRKPATDQTIDDHRARVIRLLQEDEWGSAREAWWTELREQAHIVIAPELASGASHELVHAE